MKKGAHIRATHGRGVGLLGGRHMPVVCGGSVQAGAAVIDELTVDSPRNECE